MTEIPNLRIDLTDATMNTGGPDWSIDAANVTLSAALEALLLVAEESVPAEELASFLNRTVEEIEDALRELADEYERDRRGFALREIDGGWRFFTARHVASVIAARAADRQGAKLSRAALETLAVVAYRQPISRARVAAIRGVSVDGVMRTLVSRGLVAELATDPETGAVLFGTTAYFLERMGIRSVAELPPVEDYLPDDSVLDDFADPGV